VSDVAIDFSPLTVINDVSVRRTYADTDADGQTLLTPCRCQNLEAQVRLRIEENVKSQKTRDQFIPLVDYYLAGEGGSLTAVLKTAFDVDILQLLRKVDTTRDDLIDVSLSHCNSCCWRALVPSLRLQCPISCIYLLVVQLKSQTAVSGQAAVSGHPC
jgi:hypothetical protein